jgi:hypothetical protein
MQVWVEVWPVAADQTGIWLVSGDDAWRPLISVTADTEPHAEIELILAEHGALADAQLIHSTSWRVDGPAVILTYIAVLSVIDLVRTRWPSALPISVSVAQAVGAPLTNAPNAAPTPRYIDVLKHAVRHLAFLLRNDATAATALTEPWPAHLAEIQPTLAGMYNQVHQPI